MKRSILLCLALVATTLCQAPLEELWQNDEGYLKIKNAEFLFTGGIHVKDDKYWCLHKTVYRQPSDDSVNTAPTGRTLQSLECDAGCSAMSDFLCSNKHLSFTDNTSVCKKMALVLGQKWKSFFTIEPFRQKMAFAVNYRYNEMKKIGTQPKSSYRMRQPEFLNACETQIEIEMKHLRAYLENSDVRYANRGNMSTDVIEYVLLNVEDLFIQDPIAAKDAWRNSYPSFRNKCAKKKFSEYSVRYFIEDIRLRYKPRTDIPTPDQELLGIPIFGPLTPPTPVPMVFPDLLENPKKKKIDFEFSESPVDSRGFEPYSKTGETPIPENPEEIPGDIKESIPPTKPKTSEPEEKETTPTASQKEDDKDKMTRIEIIEIQRSFNIQKALINYESLTTSMKNDIKACKLSLKGAMERCESVHGKDGCSAITPTYVGPKCAAGKVREGCCSCVDACPKGFEAHKLFCKKPVSYFTNPRTTEKDCYMANATKCEKLGDIYVAICKEGYTRSGSALCVGTCPSGTTDFGDSCSRKSKRVGDIFTWAAGEE